MVEIFAWILLVLLALALGIILLTSFFILVGSISGFDEESLHEDQE